MRGYPPPRGAGTAWVTGAGPIEHDELGEGSDPVIRVWRAPGESRPLADVLEGWLRGQARAAVERRIAARAPQLGVRPAAVAIRDQRSRWGSASSRGRLSFSWRLILAPPAVLDYVVVHELRTLRVLGHNPRFWRLVMEIVPEADLARRWLRDHARELRWTLAEVPEGRRGARLRPAVVDAVPVAQRRPVDAVHDGGGALAELHADHALQGFARRRPPLAHDGRGGEALGAPEGVEPVRVPGRSRVPELRQERREVPLAVVVVHDEDVPVRPEHPERLADPRFTGPGARWTRPPDRRSTRSASG